MLEFEGPFKPSWLRHWRKPVASPIARLALSHFLSKDRSIAVGMTMAIVAGLSAGAFQNVSSPGTAPIPAPAMQEVCQSLRVFGVETSPVPAEPGEAGGFACSTPLVRDPRSEWGDITLHANSAPSAPAIPRTIRLRGAYTTLETERATADRMLMASNAVFARLHREVPAEVREAIAYRSPRDFSGDGIHVHAGPRCTWAENADANGCAFIISVLLSPSSMPEIASSDSDFQSEDVF